jgi:hypothetical protein
MACSRTSFDFTFPEHNYFFVRPGKSLKTPLRYKPGPCIRNQWRRDVSTSSVLWYQRPPKCCFRGPNDRAGRLVQKTPVTCLVSDVHRSAKESHLSADKLVWTAEATMGFRSSEIWRRVSQQSLSSFSNQQICLHFSQQRRCPHLLFLLSVFIASLHNCAVSQGKKMPNGDFLHADLFSRKLTRNYSAIHVKIFIWNIRECLVTWCSSTAWRTHTLFQGVLYFQIIPVSNGTRWKAI